MDEREGRGVEREYGGGETVTWDAHRCNACVQSVPWPKRRRRRVAQARVACHRQGTTRTEKSGNGSRRGRRMRRRLEAWAAELEAWGGGGDARERGPAAAAAVAFYLYQRTRRGSASPRLRAQLPPLTAPSPTPPQSTAVDGSRRGWRIQRRLGARAADLATMRGAGDGLGLGRRRRGKREGAPRHRRRRLLPPRADAGGAPHHAVDAPSECLRRPLSAPPPPPQSIAAARIT
uniref:Uncharacterized protein n=1 Tax=Oryza nivara TaxID=4536 RepID=A0A0E0IB60_ORYNI